MNYFDLHADTPYRMFGENQGLAHNGFHISLEKAAVLGKYAQVMAICADSGKTDKEAYLHYLKVRDNFYKQVGECNGDAAIVTDSDGMNAALDSGKRALFFQIEDSRIIEGDISRLDDFYRDGVRFLTLVWGGESNIGGAHNTDVGLTELGKDVLSACFRLGIIPDISHASEKSADDTAALALAAKMPFIASHSNSYSVYPHSRNLRDRHFEAIKELGGIVGVSLCRSHLGNRKIEPVTVDTILKHIDYYLSLGGEDVVAFGSDFDGTDLPDGINSVSDTPLISEAMAKAGYSDRLIEKILWKNAYDFISRNLIK